MQIRDVVAIIVVVATATVGCSESTSAPDIATAQSSGSQVGPSEVANDKAQVVLESYIKASTKLVECYRHNGIPQLPDPNRFGQIIVNSNETEIDPQALRRAELACKDLQTIMPAEVRALVDADYASEVSEGERSRLREYATCMQRNGAPDFPDPQADGLAGDQDWNQDSPGARKGASACATIIGAPVTDGPGVG